MAQLGRAIHFAAGAELLRSRGEASRAPRGACPSRSRSRAAAGCAGSRRRARAGAGAGARFPRDGPARAGRPDGARSAPAARGVDDARAWGAEPGRRGARASSRASASCPGPTARSRPRTTACPRRRRRVVEVPERMGGGFLYAMGTHLWRSDTWLGRAEPLLTTPGTIGQRASSGSTACTCARSRGASSRSTRARGPLVGLGPLPAAPIARDAWRRSTRGARSRSPTCAARCSRSTRARRGARSRCPSTPPDVVPTGDAHRRRRHRRGARRCEWWEVRPDGQVGRLARARRAGERGDAAARRRDAAALDRSARPRLRAAPLAAAIEDGWPLADGTALVARDGTLGARAPVRRGARRDRRRRLPAAPRALPPARARAREATRAPSASCAASRAAARSSTGATRKSGRLVELRRFDDPREVLASGNGALAVRGPVRGRRAARRRAGLRRPGVLPACRPAARWTEMHFRGDDVDRARLVVLGDGRVALVRPPRGGDLSTARLTVTDGAHSTHLPVVMPQLRADVARALRVGHLDGRLRGAPARRASAAGSTPPARSSASRSTLGGAATVGELPARRGGRLRVGALGPRVDGVAPRASRRPTAG